MSTRVRDAMMERLAELRHEPTERRVVVDGERRGRPVTEFSRAILDEGGFRSR